MSIVKKTEDGENLFFKVLAIYNSRATKPSYKIKLRIMTS